MKSKAFIVVRALLAVVLMIGFYLLALGIALGLLYLPLAMLLYSDQFSFQILFFCLMGALMILWSVMPRFDKFPAPGPQLTRDRNPRLFDEIERLAAATRQAAPVEVFLVGDVNAWVTQRGGIMGFGSRRVMGLGLPLMRVLTCSQFRAVLAHEFGHFHGGDTKIGPWIYKTRNAIIRTLSSLRRSWLRLPFLLYGKMFLRVSQAVSRRQEFVADELAARTVGSRPLIGGLQAIHGAGPAFDLYWRNVCVPVFNSGFRPPLAEGFGQFVQSSHIVQAMSKHVETALENAKSNPYDTHPPLKERIAAVRPLRAGDVNADDPPAITLLDNVPALEQELVISIAGRSAARKLKAISWSDVCLEVYIPQWISMVKANLGGLAGITPESLPKWAADLRSLEGRFARASGHSLAGAVVGAALALLVINQGGKPEAAPGHDVSVSLGSIRLEPFSAIRALAAGQITAAVWQQYCTELGIQGVELSSSAVKPVAIKPPAS